ncbi:hypothetical protein TorRG33x02_248890 [Trema orientale]|uniref:Uncharacterized protein n=1 Tax=Trema orientale TaxID=63057 RepID=A0A2P5DK06_TREOI|nr:hypothetical protein TorRG33x02_248890 [Trema orientale]
MFHNRRRDGVLNLKLTFFLGKFTKEFPSDLVRGSFQLAREIENIEKLRELVKNQTAKQDDEQHYPIDHCVYGVRLAEVEGPSTYRLQRGFWASLKESFTRNTFRELYRFKLVTIKTKLPEAEGKEFFMAEAVQAIGEDIKLAWRLMEFRMG